MQWPRAVKVMLRCALICALRISCFAQNYGPFHVTCDRSLCMNDQPINDPMTRYLLSCDIPTWQDKIKDLKNGNLGECLGSRWWTMYFTGFFWENLLTDPMLVLLIESYNSITVVSMYFSVVNGIINFLMIGMTSKYFLDNDIIIPTGRKMKNLLTRTNLDFPYLPKE